MAARVKTVEFPFATRITSLAAATRHDYTAVTLDIPENSSRTFRSVILQITCRGNDVGSTSMTSWLLGIKLGAVAFDDVTVTDTITATGEQQTYMFTRDVTSYFVTNFGSGTSQTSEVGVQFGASATINITAKLIITYEYSDTSQTTRVKTIKIPLESGTSLLSNTLTEIGTNQVPDLSTFCPENTKTFKQIWFEVSGNEAATAATDFTLAFALDAEGEAADGNHESALNSSVWYYYIWVRNDMTTNATHAFKARSTVNNRMVHPVILLCVTYTYNHDDTTTVLNSVQFPLENHCGLLGGSVAADATRFENKLFIEEPSAITLVQSGVRINYNVSGALVGPLVRIGSQAFRTYTHTAGSLVAGMFDLMQRLDSGSAQGVGAVLARGENFIIADVYRTSTAAATFGSNTTLLCYLNYTSGKYSAGDGAHNHTTCWNVLSTAADAELLESSAMAPNIPESSYWLNNVGYEAHFILAAADSGLTLDTECKFGEGAQGGWTNIHSSLYDGHANAEIAMSISNPSATDLFDRHPIDQDVNKLAVGATRKYRVSSPTSIYSGVRMMTTHHAITYAVSGVMTGYSGDGSGINVFGFRADNNEIITSGISTTGGIYSLPWYDNVNMIYTNARQDDAHVGRSKNFVAV